MTVLDTIATIAPWAALTASVYAAWWGWQARRLTIDRHPCRRGRVCVRTFDPSVIEAAGRVVVSWPDGRGLATATPEVVEGWADQVNTLRRLLDESLTRWAQVDTRGDGALIARMRRQAGIPG